jgi:hypothetical protein
MESINGWVCLPSTNGAGFDPAAALATKKGLTMQAAKKWALEVLAEEDDDDKETEGAILVFASLGRTAGVAAVFPPKVKRNPQFQLPPGAVLFEFADNDDQAREFNSRRKAGKVPVHEQDALIAQRKSVNLGDGFELFDDWLIRQAGSSTAHVEFVMEAPVNADELELHVEPNLPPAPLAHESLQRIDEDSDEDEEEEPNMGGGHYLDYLRRQALLHLPPGRVHGADSRMIGDAEDSNLPEDLRGSFEEPRFQQPVADNEEDRELRARNAVWAPTTRMVTDTDHNESGSLPSWEAFLAGAADLLYHAPHIKADYAPFLASCIGSTDALWRFYEALYFGTVPEALAEINLNEETRPLACIRSLAYQPSGDGPLMRRPMATCSDGRKPVPVRAAPLDRYLKACGFEAPRTWISGLSEKLRQHGAGNFVSAAKTFFREAVSHGLANPKKGDPHGDIFAAWLRASHRDIYDDIDTLDCEKLMRKGFARSKSHPSHRYDLKNIHAPCFEEAFAELAMPKPSEQPSSSRQQILSKVLVDPFALRSVDLAMILKVGNIVSSAPSKSPVVVVLYAGADHTDSVTKFWRSQGFSHSGLPGKGRIGKSDFEDDEVRCLSFPSYLHDFGKLFPVPASVKDKSMKMAGAQPRRRLN